MTDTPPGSAPLLPAATVEAALEKAALRAAVALDQAWGPEALGVAMRETAHQFNNLLTVLQSSAELLGMPNLPEARRGRYLLAIHDATDRAAKLVGSLQTLARSAAPKRTTFALADRLAGRAKAAPGLSVCADAAGFDAAIATLAASLRASGAQSAPDIRVALADGRPAWHDLPVSVDPHVTITLSGAADSSAFTSHLRAILEAAELAPEWVQLFAFLARSAGALHVRTSGEDAPAFVLSLPATRMPDAA